MNINDLQEWPKDYWGRRKCDRCWGQGGWYTTNWLTRAEGQLTVVDSSGNQTLYSNGMRFQTCPQCGGSGLEPPP